MIKLDLITGFLGSGKTTFILKYAEYLTNAGQKIGIIENDNGAINVDRLLLEKELGESCDLEMVIGGDGDSCRQRRLKTKLIAMGMTGYDRVLVEPSGIFNIDELLDVLNESPLDKWYTLGSVIAVVDGTLPDELSETADYLLARQAADAGKIIFSRGDIADEDTVNATIAHINRALRTWECSRQYSRKDVLVRGPKDWTDDDFKTLMKAEYSLHDVGRRPLNSGSFSTLYFMNAELSEDELRKRTEALFNCSDCGQVFRVKGFVPNGDQWTEINATAHHIEIGPSPVGQAVIIVVGENLDEKRVGDILGVKGSGGQNAESHC